MEHERCLVVGGHQRWQSKMKQKMPWLNFIDTDASCVNEQSLSNAKFVAINTKYISHRMTLAILSMAKRTNKEIIYLNNNNVEIAAATIFSAVERKQAK